MAILQIFKIMTRFSQNVKKKIHIRILKGDIINIDLIIT